MTNLTVTLTAPEVKEIIEAHLNKTLIGKPDTLANVTQIVTGPAPAWECQPGQPTISLQITFNTVKGAAA